MAYGEFALDLLLTLLFGAMAIYCFRVVANRQRAETLASGLGSSIQKLPNWLHGSPWGYSAAAVKWYALGAGLASLNFVLIAVHLDLLVFPSVACFIVMPLIAGSRTRLRELSRGRLGALGRPRLWELIVWAVVFLYTIGVLFLASALMKPAR
jgi:hypothetical protein